MEISDKFHLEDINNLKNTIFLIPETDYKKEIEEAIKKSNLLLKEKFI